MSEAKINAAAQDGAGAEGAATGGSNVDEDADEAGEKTTMPATTTAATTQHNIAITVGTGPAATTTPAYCLLDGVYTQSTDKSSSPVRMTTPLTRLPAKLGRPIDSNDANFFGIGPTGSKQISRLQAQIDYRLNMERVAVQQTNGSDIFTVLQSALDPDNMVHLHDPDDHNDDAPFFTLTVLSKNKAHVNGVPIEQHKTCVLRNGDAIRIQSLEAYFLVPHQHVRKRSLDDDENAVEGVDYVNVARKVMKTVVVEDENAGVTVRRPSVVASAGALPPAITASSSTPVNDNNAELSEIATLIDRFITLSGENSRPPQGMNSKIALRLIGVAARDAALREQALQQQGLERQTILAWIKEHPVLGRWVSFQLENVEATSYRATMTKAMQTAGFERLGSRGRFIKWNFPPLDGTAPSVLSTLPTGSGHTTVATHDEEDNGNDNDEDDEDEEE